MIRIYVPRDSAARAVGADEVVDAIVEEAAAQKINVQIIRNGSRGMMWLEPLVEVETPKGRVAYGPVEADDVKSLFNSKFHEGGKHKLALGLTEELPYLKNQERLTFARCGITDPLSLADYTSLGGFVGLKKALAMKGAEIVTEVTTSGLRGRGGAGFPTGIKWKTVHDAKADQKYVCCNADEGDSGTFADRMVMEGDPFMLIEGMTIAGIAVRSHDRLHLYPLGISRCDQRDEGCHSHCNVREMAGTKYSRYGAFLLARSAHGCWRLHLR